jgi:hypothetical protein
MSPQKRTQVWVVNCYNELYNLIIIIRIFNNVFHFLDFWSITSLLAFDIRTFLEKTVNIFFFKFDTDNSHLYRFYFKRIYEKLKNVLRYECFDNHLQGDGIK